MSLTAHILLNCVTQLPQGKLREHFMEPPRVSFGQPGQISRNIEIQERNIEQVFNAVKYGISTANEICELTGLSKNTVLRALNSLYTWPGGPRCTFTRGERVRGGAPYIWKVAK